MFALFCYDDKLIFVVQFRVTINSYLPIILLNFLPLGLSVSLQSVVLCGGFCLFMSGVTVFLNADFFG